MTTNENTQVPCYVSERLLRLDQATRNSMHTQVPGLSVLPRKHRTQQQQQRVRYHNNIIRSIIIGILQIYHARFQVQRLRVIIDYTNTHIILTIHHKHILHTQSNFFVNHPNQTNQVIMMQCDSTMTQCMWYQSPWFIQSNQINHIHLS